MNPLATDIFNRAMEAMRPGQLVRENMKLAGKRLRIRNDNHLISSKKVYLVAGGKAALEMGSVAAEILGNNLEKGIIIIPQGEEAGDLASTNIEVFEASHPVPAQDSLEAAEALVRFLQEIPPGSLIINCLSGGTSSLLTLPGEGIPIEELNRAFGLLLNSGAGIHEINAVRKHLSRVKGGQLLRHMDPSVTLVDLIISDVPGDDPQVIGSGPTSPDASTYGDACRVLSKYKLWERMPASVHRYLDKGFNGMLPETVKPGEDPVKNHRQHIIGSARMLAERTAGIALQEEYHTWIAGEPFNTDVHNVAEMIGTRARSVVDKRSPVRPPAALVFYGESRVNVKGEGKGGRNQELALLGALQIEGYEKITWLSAGTDGVDGPTDAAGAVVDGSTVSKAKEEGLNPEAYLAGNNSYVFHDQLGTLLKTGPTGNNLMDLQLILVE